MDTDYNDRSRGHTYTGPLSHFLRHTREVVEDMEQPLDLSQRETTIERSPKVVNIDMEEPICQYTNCTCPLKHILSLDKKEQGSSENFTQMRETVTSDVYSRGPIHKRIQQTEDSQSHFHPKRRKIEQYKHSISRSASDTNLHGYGGPVDSYRSFTGYPGEDIHHGIHEGKYQSNWKSSHTFTAPNTYQYASGDISNPEVKPKHMERLPKKRSHARNLSYDNLIQNSQNSNMSNSCSSEMETSRTPSPKIISTNTNMSQEGSEEAKVYDCSNLPELHSGRRTNGEELRASIMAELHNEKDDEDVNEFRKRFFGSIFSRAKQGPALKGKPSAFDILIPGKHSENFDFHDFRPKNSHIDQIIRGEKAGKLCLMDIVELQVEIGLA